MAFLLRTTLLFKIVGIKKIRFTIKTQHITYSTQGAHKYPVQWQYLTQFVFHPFV